MDELKHLVPTWSLLRWAARSMRRSVRYKDEGLMCDGLVPHIAVGGDAAHRPRISSSDKGPFGLE